jgi:hypothetical protein
VLKKKPLNCSGLLLAAALALQTPLGLAQERPALKGITGIRVSNYGAPSKLFEGKEEMNEILTELEELRGKRWRTSDLRMRCYASVQLLNGNKPVTVFRVRPEYVVERAQDKAVATYSMQITESDLPKLRKILTEVPPSKDCG